MTEAPAMSVKSAGRVLDIFELLAAEPEGLSVTEVGARLGIARSSAYALVTTLAARGYLRRQGTESKRFTLGVPLVQLGLSVTDRLELRTVARGVLERLVAAWHETALLAVAAGAEIVYIDKVVSDQFGFRTDPRVSARRPIHSHSLGKALLAAAGDEPVEALIEARELEAVTEFTIVDPEKLLEDLRRTRERGFAMDQQEAVLGVCCVGAPVRDHTGHLAAAISLATIREYYRPEVTGPAVREGAFQISRAMGWSGGLEDLYTTVPGAAGLLGYGGVDGAEALHATVKGAR
jgi:IclR family transcriptional regulator, KDG regulon repressor